MVVSINVAIVSTDGLPHRNENYKYFDKIFTPLSSLRFLQNILFIIDFLIFSVQLYLFFEIESHPRFSHFVSNVLSP